MNSLRWILLVLSLFNFYPNVNAVSLEIFKTLKIQACGEKLYHVMRFTCSSQYRRKRSLSMPSNMDKIGLTDPKSMEFLSQSQSLKATEMEDLITKFGEDLRSEDMRLLSFLVKEKAVFFHHSEPLSSGGSPYWTPGSKNSSPVTPLSNTQSRSQNLTVITQNTSQNLMVNTLNRSQRSTLNTQNRYQNITVNTLVKSQTSTVNLKNGSESSTARSDTGRTFRSRRSVTDECCISSCWLLTLLSYCGQNRLG